MARPLPRVGRAGGVLAAVVLTGAVLAGCGSSHRPEPVSAMAPGWTIPAPAGGPSTTAFCRLLATDFGHLHTGATTTRLQDVEANYTGFIDASHTVEAAAPPAIAADARVFIATTANFYQALLEHAVQHTNGSKELGDELSSPATLTAIRTVETFVKANCDPDPLG